MSRSSAIQGSGEQGRQFTHATDVALGFEAALTKGTIGAAYNLVSDRMVTIRELAEMVTTLAPTKITFGEARPADVPSALVSNKLARAELNWAPRMDFEVGLREIFDEIQSATPARFG